MDLMGSAIGVNFDEEKDVVTVLTNPIAATVGLATGSFQKGAQAADLVTVAKAGAGLLKGKEPNVPEVASSIAGATAATKAAVNTVKSNIAGALAPTPAPPATPKPPSPPPCSASTGGCK
jgi:hypothetical protein